ncbi:dihydrodipicolinate synthase [Rarobacter incanus]|uniref:4-hydroxy-tetrahydrodipicolinate synthase n=1 Tax=Rarobacter incanus TaxID=153494 RepID=A0A542SLF3_9MICO|nr:dihydrodipicolinate synthase [Rarobacter incanus]
MIADSTPPFGQLLTAMVTPFTDKGVVDVEAAVSLAKHLVDQGNDGLVLHGTTGEAPTTHSPEKSEVISAVVEAVGERAVVIAGAGSNDTVHAVRMAEQAAAAGAHGLLVVTPYYSRPSQAGAAAHFKAVAGASDLPVMLYDIPGRAGLRIAPQTYDDVAQLDNVVAVKDATGDVYTAALNQARTGLALYSGDDGLYLPFLSVGAVGLVSVVSHIATPSFVKIRQAWERGDHTAAIAEFHAVTPLIEAIMGGGIGAVMAKEALHIMGLLPSAALRLPQVGAEPQQRKELETTLRAFGLTS